MKIKELHISQTGRRPYNEDALYAGDLIYMVCDGVGGSSKGEVASRLACDTIAGYCKNIKDHSLTEQEVQQAIALTETAFRDHIRTNPESKGMATTVTLLHFFDETATIAHAGDSRVYHIRNGKILFQTKDHSLVNDLVASGYLSAEDAVNHPKRNVITRALEAGEEPLLADIACIDYIQAGDFFILCSDGLLEGIDNKYIEQHFIAGAGLEKLVENIDLICASRSNDNYTGIFIEIS